MTGLFVKETFRGHSGGLLHWKVECDALEKDDWLGLAMIIRERLYEQPGFKGYRAAWGIPRGGIPFAEALNMNVNPKSNLLLLVDDVWTTGGSMREEQKKFVEHRMLGDLAVYDEDVLMGVVAFARSPVDAWVRAVWVRGGFANG